MSRPLVAIVGRPNVGKSTLFNKLLGRRRAIIRNVHGVTRDRNYGDLTWDDSDLTLIDTGGFFPGTDDNMFSSIKKQALYAIEEADIILHLLDGKEGLNPLDIELANEIRKTGSKTLWVINKIDSFEKESRLSDFYPIGAEELIPVSAENGYGIDDLMEKVISILPDSHPAPSDDLPKIAIVGRPNVGKSTIVNTVLGKERMIVSPQAGTTRDSIDSVCSYYRKKYLIIDTAGIRKKPRVDEPIEEMSVMRAIKSIERADVVIAVLDATSGVVEQDQRIIGIAEKKGKGLLIVFNKWDLVDDQEKAYKRLMKEASSKLWFVPYAPLLTTSALVKKRVFKMFPIIREIIAEKNKRISTPELNRFKETIESSMPNHKGKRVKLYYITQVGMNPPAFAFFVSATAGIKDQHKKMIERLLRNKYPYTGTPVRIYIRGRKKK
ncbi:MAG: ribosome biogenesis GTPase Der [Nitrospirota bacterium]|nr:MAG: ribosome biogenesis GTPase Der [Nitrospirota bacterium]